MKIITLDAYPLQRKGEGGHSPVSISWSYTQYLHSENGSFFVNTWKFCQIEGNDRLNIGCTKMRFEKTEQKQVMDFLPLHGCQSSPLNFNRKNAIERKISQNWVYGWITIREQEWLKLTGWERSCQTAQKMKQMEQVKCKDLPSTVTSSNLNIKYLWRRRILSSSNN